ncbi:MAG: DoxX family protein [Cyclobacteriaceae bacterium]|nr:DoxX family protein [Cyclobacteriaceae bacterium]
MNITQKLSSFKHYVDIHHPMWLDIIRIFLGIAIFIKGIFFIQNSDALLEIMQNSQIKGWAFIVEHQVAFTYLVGGILIAMGLLTRVAIAFSLLVFFGSIFCYVTQTGFFSVYSDLAFSVIVFVLLIFYMILGPGKFSVDAYMKIHKKEGQE